MSGTHISPLILSWWSILESYLWVYAEEAGQMEDPGSPLRLSECFITYLPASSSVKIAKKISGFTSDEMRQCSAGETL